MAANKQAYIGNVLGCDGPYRVKGLFQAGTTQLIKRGEILELSGGNWIPLDADQAMAAVVAIADEEIKSADRAGYYWILVPRPGDIWEFELATAAALSVGTALYWSTSQKVTNTVGTNILGYVVGQEQYPDKQGHVSDDASGDAGVTITSKTYVRMAITAAASYWAALWA